MAAVETCRHHVVARSQAQDCPHRLPLQHLDCQAGKAALCCYLLPAALLLLAACRLAATCCLLLCLLLCLLRCLLHCVSVVCCLLPISPLDASTDTQVKLGGAALFGEVAAPYMLPPEMRVHVVRPPLNIGVNEREKQDWRTALARLIETVDAAGPFDLALLSCGGLGMLLAHHLRRTGRSSLYMGGSLQLQFGIKGKRWLTMQEYREAMDNPNWVKPDASERPPSSHVIENSAYWFDDEKQKSEKQKPGGEKRSSPRQPYQQLPWKPHGSKTMAARAHMGGHGGLSRQPAMQPHVGARGGGLQAHHPNYPIA